MTYPMYLVLGVVVVVHKIQLVMQEMVKITKIDEMGGFCAVVLV